MAYTTTSSNTSTTAASKPPEALTWSLRKDTGASASDGVTSDGLVQIGNLNPGDIWRYSIDGGHSWFIGIGQSFLLPPGRLAAGAVQMQRFSASGTPSAITKSNMDLVIDQAVTVPLMSMVKSSLVAGAVHSTGEFQVSGLEAGARWEYSVNGGSTWISGNGTGFKVPADTKTPTVYAREAIQVRQIDLAGNVSLAAKNLLAVTIPTTPTALTLNLRKDTGASSSDGISSDGVLLVEGLAAGARWKYSLDGGKSWANGNGTTLTLAAGQYDQGKVKVVQVGEFDIESPVTTYARSLTIDTVAVGLTMSVKQMQQVGDIRFSDGLIEVSGLEAGARWEYSVDAGQSWRPGSATSFQVPTSTTADTVCLAGMVQVRQVDLAGNVSTVTRNGNAFIVVRPASPLTLSLMRDTGAFTDDGITSDGRLKVNGLTKGARWNYSTDSGKTWQEGVGDTLTLAAGKHAAGEVQVRPLNAIGRPGDRTVWNTDLTIDLQVDPLVVTMGSSIVAGGVTWSNGEFRISGLESGARWEYSQDGGLHWLAGKGTGFSLRDLDGPTGPLASGAVQVRQVDLAGNVSAVTRHQGDFSLVRAPVAPSLGLRQDTGSDAHDGKTSDASLKIGSIDPASTWQYSVDGGKTWQAGSGTSFELARGHHEAGTIQVRQINVFGEVSNITRIDQPLDIELAVSLVSDTGISASDGITQDGTLQVEGLSAGRAWQYSLDGGRHWQDGSGNRLSLPTGIRQQLVNGTFKNGSSGWTSDFANATVNTSFQGRAEQMFMSVYSGQEGGSDPAFYVQQLDIETTTRNAWATTFDLVEGGDYVFSGYAAFGVECSPQEAVYTILLDGVQVGDPRTASVSDGWQGFSQALTGLSAGVHSLSIRAVRSKDNSTYTLFALDSLKVATSGDNPVYTGGSVKVRQTLDSGEVINGSLSRRVEFDTTAPTVALLNVNTDSLSGLSRIVVTGLEVGTRQELSIDGGPWESLGPRSSVMPLTGSHTYVTRQTDLSGRESLSKAITLDVAAPTPTQLRAMPRDWLPGFTLAQLQEAVAGSATVIELLDATQMPGLTQAQLNGADATGRPLLTHLSTAQVQGLSASQITALPASAFSLKDASGHTLLAVLTTPQLVALSGTQLQWVDAAGNSLFSHLSTAQIQALTIDQVRMLPGEALLRPDQDGDVLMSQLRLDQLAQLGNRQLLALDEGQVDRLHDHTLAKLAASLSSTLVRQACELELGELSHSSLLHFFQKVQQGLQDRATRLAADELGDLRAVAEFVAEQQGRDSYLGGITHSLVHGDKFNTYWTAGGTLMTEMGDLAVGSSATQLDRLIKTWLLGQNDPVESAGQQVDNSPLWGAGGPKVTDVQQGAYSDCTGMSAMAALCQSDPAYLMSLFTDNGNGTYGVRMGGQQYTFDNHFSVKGSSARSGVLWPRLLEKAWYAAAFDQLSFPTMVYEDEYLNIEPYGGCAMITMTARSDNEAWSFKRTVLSIDDGIDRIRQNLQSALQHKDFVSFGSSSNQGGRVAGHQYAVLGYDAGTDRVTLYNPWGYRVDYALSDLVASSFDRFFIVGNPIAAKMPGGIRMSLAVDTGASASDQVTSSHTLQLDGLGDGLHWQYSTDGQMSWHEGSGNRLFLWEGHYDPQQVQVRTLSADGKVVDQAGNTNRLLIDDHAQTPLMLVTDTGLSAMDGITSSAVFSVDRLEQGGQWRVRIDDGIWQAGTGSSFKAQEGRHSYTVQQTDAAGNVSQTSSVNVLLDTVAPAAASFKLVSAATNHGVIEVSSGETGAQLAGSLDFGKTWTVLKSDAAGHAKLDVPALTSAINQISNGNFKAGTDRDWQSGYDSAALATPPSQLGDGTSTGLSSGQAGAGDTALVVRGVDIGTFDRDVWAAKVYLGKGLDHELTGYLAAAVTCSYVDTKYQIRIDNVAVGTYAMAGFGWQGFRQVLHGQSEGMHTVSIRASIGDTYVDSLFAVDSLTLTTAGQRPLYEPGAIQVRSTDLAGNSSWSHNAATLDWNQLGTNLAVI